MEIPDDNTTKQERVEEQPTSGKVTPPQWSLPWDLSNFRVWFDNLVVRIQHFLVSLKHQRKCPYCLALIRNTSHRQVGKAVIPQCSSCGHDLPSDFFATKGKVIALVGGPDTAKSTYITVLVDQLLSNRSILKTLNIQAGIIDREGKSFYNRQREKLVIQNEILDTTERLESGGATPIVLRLRRSDTKRRDVMFLTLFDTPGDEFNDPDLITEHHPHIANADALIFMIDPLNIESIFHEVREYITEEEDIFMEGLYQIDFDIINNLIEVFGREKKINPLGKVNAPVSFCLSKVDLLDQLMSIYIPEDIDHELMASREIFEEIEFTSKDLHEFLLEKDTRLVNNIENHFERFEFFPVAPIGKIPQGHSIREGIEPKGVLHPLIWVLHKVNFV